MKSVAGGLRLKVRGGSKRQEVRSRMQIITILLFAVIYILSFFSECWLLTSVFSDFRPPTSDFIYAETPLADKSGALIYYNNLRTDATSTFVADLIIYKQMLLYDAFTTGYCLLFGAVVTGIVLPERHPV
jgi:hypothetical protein